MRDHLFLRVMPVEFDSIRQYESVNEICGGFSLKELALEVYRGPK